MDIERANQLARLFRILTIVKSQSRGDTIGREYLAKAAGCSPRTIQRDIDTLCAAHVPIEYCRKTNSYVLTNDDWTYPTVDLTPTDILALGLLSAWISSSYDSVPYASEIKVALTKATSSLSPSMLNSLEGVGTYLAQMGGTARKYSRAPIGELIQASMENRTIEILYDSRSSSSAGPSFRRIDPYRLDRRDAQYFELQAFCHKNQEMRTFAPDRIHEIRLTGDFFKRRRDALVDVGVVGGLRSALMVDVEVRFSATVSSYALEHGWPTTLSFEGSPGEAVVMRGTVQGTDAIVKQLLRWGQHVQVLGGEVLRSAIKQEIEKMSQHYI